MREILSFSKTKKEGFMMLNHESYIAGSGRYLPNKYYLPKEILSSLSVKKSHFTEKWLREDVGIGRKYRAGEKTSTVRMGIVSAQRAFKRSKVHPEEVDLVVFTSMTHLDPNIEELKESLRYKLGTKNAKILFINSACAGFIQVIKRIEAYVRKRNDCVRILIVTSNKFTDITSIECARHVAFSDGAASLILVINPDKSNILACHIHTDRSKSKLLFINPKNNQMALKGYPLSELSCKVLPISMRYSLEMANLDVPNLDYLFINQSNIQVVGKIASEIGIPQTKLHLTMHKYGYTGSASIPMAIDTALRRGEIRRGDKIGIGALGGGIKYGTAVLTV